MKKALVTGIAGQDGSYLAELLISKGYEVWGLMRGEEMRGYVPKSVHILKGDLEDQESLRAAVRTSVPDEVYNLGGISDLKTAFESPERTHATNYISVGVLLEEAQKTNSGVRFLQASSSEVFLPSPDQLNEHSERDWMTQNPYARAKMMADRDFIVQSRTKKNMYSCSAILFNHESPRRSERSIIRKITRTLSRIKKGDNICLRIGNPDMRRDWGFAGDYVYAMWQILQIDAPEDMVIATGILHSVKDVIAIATRILNMELTWQGEGTHTHAVNQVGKKIIEIDPELYKPADTHPKKGDIRKAASMIQWQPKVSFEELVNMMTEADYTQEHIS